jgi:hypothetical protein
MGLSASGSSSWLHGCTSQPLMPTPSRPFRAPPHMAPLAQQLGILLCCAAPRSHHLVLHPATAAAGPSSTYTSLVSGITFYFNLSADSYDSAEAGCNSGGGHLATYGSIEEQYDVESYVGGPPACLSA